MSFFIFRTITITINDGRPLHDPGGLRPPLLRDLQRLRAAHGLVGGHGEDRPVGVGGRIGQERDGGVAEGERPTPVRFPRVSRAPDARRTTKTSEGPFFAGGRGRGPRRSSDVRGWPRRVEILARGGRVATPQMFMCFFRLLLWDDSIALSKMFTSEMLQHDFRLSQSAPFG